MERQIILRGQVITYELIRKRVKNVNLRIHNDGSIVVSCNSRVTIGFIEKFMKEREDFILDGLSKVSIRISNASRPVSYSEGEEVSVFGEKCVINVLKGKTGKVIFEYPKVYLIVKDPENFDQRKRVYEKWKKEQVRDRVLEMCEYYFPYFKERGVKYPSKITFRTMTSKWGCCRPVSGILTFNNNLFEVPFECMSYVVVHELAHFLEANHSARFYKHVEAVMPDYKIRRKTLNEY